ncbi:MULTISPECIES: hypothetical protein [unclassified Wolbachia]|uniref:hypothetical protein n=1 Tax=unclassified Wolbachia TaxID=2640676 RepID=UPI0022304342|nr:hypothetical protein [Wolbachia endosymbiont (group A) of Apoderus coryli]
MIIMTMKNYRSKKFTLLCNLQILLRARAIGVIQVPPSRHLSSLLFLSSQCLTLGSRKKNGVMKVADTDFHPKGCHPSVWALG